MYSLDVHTSVAETIEEQIGDTDEPPRHFSVSLMRPATGDEVGMSVIQGGAKFELLKVTALRERSLVDASKKANTQKSDPPR